MLHCLLVYKLRGVKIT